MNQPAVTRPEGYWRSLLFLNCYRSIIAGLLLGTWAIMHEQPSWSEYNAPLFFGAALGYLSFGMFSIAATMTRWPRFNRQLSIQVAGDVFFITTIMYASGGVKSGFGLLLVIAIAGASLVSQGRLALFYAAIATIAVLLEQSWQLLNWDDIYQDYTHAVMLSLSFFATAWLAHTFAKRTEESEALASQRGVDLANLSEVNQLIIRDMPDGVLVVDQKLQLRQLNDQAREFLSLPDEAIEKAPLIKFAPELTARLHNWMTDSSSGESASSVISGGRELQLRFLPVGSGRDQGAVVYIRDYSQVKAQAQQLKLAALGRLTANIAHEIRNPLSSISHAAQLLLEDSGANASHRRLLDIIGANVQRLDGMVQDVLQLNRSDRARPESIESKGFLADFLLQFCQMETIPDDTIQLSMAGKSPTLFFDRDHLQQVLWNLCRNAWRHSSKSAGSIHISLQSFHDRGFIVVRDDGPGVDPEAVPHLFEPFYTTEPSGTGLGLYIARELCEANGARIEYLLSPEGCTFRIDTRTIA